MTSHLPQIALPALQPCPVAVLFPATPAAVGRARRHAVRQLMQWGHDPDGDTGQVAALVVSELCANAVRHGHVAGRGFRLRLALGAVMLRIEVTDAGSALPPDNPRTAGPECEYGRGLALVEALTLRWGMRPELIGKTVWCELEANGG